MNAQDLSEPTVSDDLDEALGVADRNGLPVRGERKPADLDVVPFFLRLLLGKADARDLRVTVDAGRNT